MTTQTVFIAVNACDASNHFTMELTEEEFAVLKKIEAANNDERIRQYGCHPELEISIERPEYSFNLGGRYTGDNGDEYAIFNASGEFVEMHGGDDDEN